MSRNRIASLTGSVVALTLLSSGAALHAGSVITTNLSAGNVAIANIDATNDGADLSNQSVWNNPFSLNDTLPTVTLQPGTYHFRIVNAADALTLNPSLTAPQQAQIFAGWTYNSPWIEDYLAFDAADNTVTQLFDGAPSPTAYNSAAAAYAGAIADGTYDDIRLGSRSNPVILSNYDYVVTTTTTFQFAIPDNGVGDNGGGVSVLISGLPEPTSAAAILIVGMLASRRRRVR